MKHICRNWNLVLCTSAIVALCCFGAGLRSARGQNSLAGWAEREYTVQPAKSVPFFQLTTVLGSGAFANAQAGTFADYYNQSVFPLVTRKDNRGSSNDVIAKLRNNFKKCEVASNPQVFNTLVDLTLDYMTKIADGSQYHPVARVNAVLAMGEANSPKTVDALLATFQFANQIDAVRVAVLADLIRLADSKRQPKGCLTAASPSAEKVIDLMFRIVRLKVPATTRADGIRWMRGQAADVLAELKGTSGGKVPPALLEMLKDKEMPVPLRCKAALALGSLSYEGSVPAAGPYLTALAELADDALGSDQPADRGRVELVSRDVQAGAKPFSASANPNDQVLLDGLLKPMQTLDKEIATAPEELATAMAKAKESLDRLLKKK